MSLDLAVWHSPVNASQDPIDTYERLADGDWQIVSPSQAVAQFRDDLLRLYPGWEDVIEGPPDRYVMMTLPFHWATESSLETVAELAEKHGLILHDPQQTFRD
jgi:hypothetical protein